MKYFVEINGEKFQVELPVDSNPATAVINGNTLSISNIVRSDTNGLSLIIDQKPYSINIVSEEENLNVLVDGEELSAIVWDERTESVRKLIGNKAGKQTKAGNIKAPMPGLVIKVNVAEGDTVTKGESLLIVEAMKMENEILSPVSGVVAKCHVEQGMAVNRHQMLIQID